MTVGHAVSVVGGAIVLVCSALAWAGVLQSWAYGYQGLAVVTFVPPLGLCAVAYGLQPVVPLQVFGALALPGSLWFIVGFFIFTSRPRWFAPRWVKEKWRRRGEDGWPTS